MVNIHIPLYTRHEYVHRYVHLYVCIHIDIYTHICTEKRIIRQHRKHSTSIGIYFVCMIIYFVQHSAFVRYIHYRSLYTLAYVAIRIEANNTCIHTQTHTHIYIHKQTININKNKHIESVNNMLEVSSRECL
eukprot:GHVQ01020562.1.p1 GENE.GHVQ01020562.1~~GHVQ01020562.1.p1  ORF type:complete len:132 (+),score=3.84 GHVQ01020562.1:114-509(+)